MAELNTHHAAQAHAASIPTRREAGAIADAGSVRPGPDGSAAQQAARASRDPNVASMAGLALDGEPEPNAELDLSSCDREPIHVPGSIQPHGFLLALDPDSLRVRMASANASEYLARPLASIFGHTPAELLGDQTGTRLTAELLSEDCEGEGSPVASRLLSTVSLPIQGSAPLAFEVAAHRTHVVQGERSRASTAQEASAMGPGPGPAEAVHTDGEGAGECLVVEFEPTLDPHATEPVNVEHLNTRLYNFVSANRGHRSAPAVMQAAATELRTLTGCDRVVLYRFDEEGHGLVLAEDRGEQFASYLGLRFPASDVPQQARRMYELNRVRIIPNVDYTPSPLLADPDNAPALLAELREGATLDLSSSILRSVSPVHRAYMRNMGTACSMSVSIMVDQKLWGLVSCHHHEPRYVPLRLRLACDLVMQVVAAQIEAQQNIDHLKRVEHARSIQGRLLSSMASNSHYMDGLLQNPELLKDLLHADGVAVVQGKTVALFGVTPNEEQLLRLTEWIRQREPSEIFVSSHLSAQCPEAAEFVEEGSGVIAASLSKIHSTHVLWFRREIVSTVRWAGDPQKPALPQNAAPLAAGVTVNPRHSFEEWSQIVRGQSIPWKREEAEAARHFRGSVLEIVLKRAEELAELAAGLKVANDELEAFSYSVSHDLRAPFRHISGFSEMLFEEDGDRMSATGQQYLKTIMDSARFAGILVDSLLDFSRIARTRIKRLPINMEQLADSEWQAVLQVEGRGRTIDFERGSLPQVMGDANLMRQVLRNLFSNAVKYTGGVERTRIVLSAVERDQEAIFSIQDNGAGFDQQYAGKLFGVFQRLHRADEFDGIGIGLANVRRIVSRHGGSTWAEGEIGKGATFFFSMPVPFHEEGA